MALFSCKIFFASLLILVALFGVVVGGTVHKVGDSNGWTMMGVDYQGWASSRNFKVGDSLVFQYNNELHDVTEVTPNDFVLCDMTKPLTKYQSGFDTITLTKPGVYSYICGVPGHCEVGQKIQLFVLPAPVRSPSSSLSPLADSPANAPLYQMAPSPLQSGASKSSGSWKGFSLLALILLF